MGAAYDSQERDLAPRCHPGTRSEILEKVDAWANAGAEGTGILWLHGPAGAGKLAIAQTVAEKYAMAKPSRGNLLFCSNCCPPQLYQISLSDDCYANRAV